MKILRATPRMVDALLWKLIGTGQSYLIRNLYFRKVEK